jgi:deazaflavin-dependent oxidoreductase (nitroreductase family)
LHARGDVPAQWRCGGSRIRSSARWLAVRLLPGLPLLAGIAPWWVLLETTGRRSGVRRHTPLAAGPFDGRTMWLTAAQGRHCNFVRNIPADPHVGLRHRRRRYVATAQIHAIDAERLRHFNPYTRSGPRAVGIEPQFVKVTINS